MAQLLLPAAAVIFVYMTAWFVLALILKNNSIVDIAWGPGFVLTATVLFIRGSALDPVKILYLTLISVWGVRLAAHIFRRNFGKAEDFRYADMRKRWGKSFAAKSFVYVFMLQGVLMLIVSSPSLVVFGSPARRITILDIAGTVVFLSGLIFEAVSDLQLSRHVRNPGNKGKLQTGGLWSLSRHPNHFGEAVLWWGLGLLALSSKSGWIGLVGPAAITFLLRFVSGVPLLEKKYAGRPDWEAYKLKTPIFLPRLPRPR